MAKMDKFKDTQAERIGDILNSQSYPMQSFAVPRFQRNYAWRDEVDRMWTDMYDYYIEHREETAENLFEGQYMLGPMVMLRDGGDGYEWQVIDGQQRLATLTTLFCVIRDLFSVLKDKMDDDEGYKLSRKLIEKETFKDKKEPKLKLNQKDRIFFAKMVQAEGNPAKKLSSWNAEIKGQKKSVPASHKLIMRCYEVLYDNVCNALITGFVQRGKIEDELGYKEAELKSEIMKNMVANPAEYSLPVDFFENHWNGYEFIHDGKVSEEELNKYNQIKIKPSGRRHQDLKEYVEYTIMQKKNKLSKVLRNAVKEKSSAILETYGINNINMLTKFLKYITQQNFVVSARVENENDASMIFEALNARGKRLTKSELVKNMCFRVVKDENEIVELDGRWIDIFNEELKSGDNFVRESLRSRWFHKYKNPDTSTNFNTSTANLLKIVADVINGDEKNAKDYIGKLEEDSKFVKMMDTPASCSDDDEVKYNLIALDRLNAIHIRTPLLTGYRRWGLGQEFRKFSDKLIKFHFRNMTVGNDLHTSKMERLMLTIAESVANGENLSDIINRLRDVDLGDDDFEEKFAKLRIEEGESIKYILLEIERHLRGMHPVIQLEADATVEHILPKKPSDEWSKDEFFKEWDKEDQDFKSHSSRIGNMTLLSKSPNSRIKNRSFCIKRTEAYLHENVLKVTTETVLKMAKCAEELEKNDPEFQSIKEWTAVVIDERCKCFAKLAKTIWFL